MEKNWHKEMKHSSALSNSDINMNEFICEPDHSMWNWVGNISFGIEYGECEKIFFRF